MPLGRRQARNLRGETAMLRERLSEPAAGPARHLTPTRFVIARSVATRRSRYRAGVRCPAEIAALRSQ